MKHSYNEREKNPKYLGTRQCIGGLVEEPIMYNSHRTLLLAMSAHIFPVKGDSVEETHMYNPRHAAKFEFSFPVTLCLPF